MARRRTLALALLALAVSLAAVSAASGKGKPTPQLTGTWLTTISLTSPPPGVEAAFQALDTFVPGGGILVSSSQSHPTARGLAHGHCEHGTGRQFTCTFVWFRFDPAAGTYLGMQRVRRTMQLSADGSSFQASDTVEVLTPAGAVVASIQGTETGQRLR
jgi:hypothetical protein